MPWNILHIDTEKTWRGGERQISFLVSLLSRNEFTNIVAAPHESALFREITRQNHLIIPFNACGEWDIFAAWRLARIVRKYGIHIMHAHTSHALGIAAVASLWCSAPIVASRRVDYHLNKNMFSRWKYRRAKRIIAISDAVKNILIEDGIDSKIIEVAKSGIIFNPRIPINIPAKRKELNIPPACPIIGTIGALTEQKDHETFLKAAAIIKKIHPAVRFMIVGDGELRGILKKTIHDLALDDSVVLTGFRNDVMEILALFDIYVMSSRYEAMGTATLDAMYYEKPVVATKVGGIPEIVGEGVTGFLVAAGDYSALAEKILYLLHHPHQAQNFGKAGGKKVADFSAEKTAFTIADIYRTILI